MDEGGKQLIGDVREPLPVRPKSPMKQDHEYERAGIANLFMAFEPLSGQRHVAVTERKTAEDFARFLKRLSDEWYSAALGIVLVCDNLNTHTPAALYEAFEPTEARHLAARFEWHHTPKHGSWLNMAEMELSGVSFASKCRKSSRATWWPTWDSRSRPLRTWPGSNRRPPAPSGRISSWRWRCVGSPAHRPEWTYASASSVRR